MAKTLPKLATQRFMYTARFANYKPGGRSDVVEYGSTLGEGRQLAVHASTELGNQIATGTVRPLLCPDKREPRESAEDRALCAQAMDRRN